MLGWLDASTPLKREQATRVSYNTLTHSRLYCRDREKKLVMNKELYSPVLDLHRIVNWLAYLESR